MHVLCVLFSALLNSFPYTSKQLQTLDFPHQMNMNSWQNNTLTDFNNSQQQPFIQAWRTREKLKKHTLEVSKNEVVQKFPAREALEKKKLKRKRSYGKRWEISRFFSQFCSLIGLYKGKSKVKDDYWLWREMTHMSLHFFQLSKLVPTPFNCSI